METKLCRVILFAHPREDVEQMYLCGETRSSGEWIAEAATPMKRTPEGWRAIKYLPVGSTFRFKVLRDNSWHGVEKGTWGEEIDNHVITAEKGLVVHMNIPNFRQD